MARKTISTIIIILIVLFMAILAINFTKKSTNQSDNILLDLQVATGNMYSAEELTSKPTLVVIWTTWCSGCLHEMAYIKENHKEFEKRVNIIAINSTLSERSIDDVYHFLERANLPFVVLIDEEGSSQKQFPSRAIPANFLLNTEGEIVANGAGPIELDELDGWLKALAEQSEINNR